MTFSIVFFFANAGLLVLNLFLRAELKRLGRSAWVPTVGAVAATIGMVAAAIGFVLAVTS